MFVIYWINHCLFLDFVISRIRWHKDFMTLPRVYQGCPALDCWHILCWTSGNSTVFRRPVHVVGVRLPSLELSRALLLGIGALINGLRVLHEIKGYECSTFPLLAGRVYTWSFPDSSKLFSFCSALHNSPLHFTSTWDLLLSFAPSSSILPGTCALSGVLPLHGSSSSNRPGNYLSVFKSFRV